MNNTLQDRESGRQQVDTVPATWDYLDACWNDFLSRLREARKKIGASRHSAWFRGQEDETWALSPALFRGQRYIESQDETAAIARAREDLSNARAKRQSLQHSSGRMPPELRDQYEATRACEKDAKKKLQNILAGGFRPVLGEADAYHDWIYRAGRHYGSSWQALAEMQHYQVKTRLLDWTESATVGLFFALKEYRRVLDPIWRSFNGRAQRSERPHSDRYEALVPQNLPTPTLWVLNPYNLAKHATDSPGGEVLNPAANQRHDYYESFIEKMNWRYERPIPMYPWWGDLRIRAQHGMFTVFGTCHAPLDKQIGHRHGVWARVSLSAPTAVAALAHLRELTALNDFTVFQDRDALGQYITRRFLTA